jgi:hypothetical protein
MTRVEVRKVFGPRERTRGGPPRIRGQERYRLAEVGAPACRTALLGGGRNAGLLAVQILAASDASLREKVVRFRQRLAAESRAKNRRLQAGAGGG